MDNLFELILKKATVKDLELFKEILTENIKQIDVELKLRGR